VTVIAERTANVLTVDPRELISPELFAQLVGRIMRDEHVNKLYAERVMTQAFAYKWSSSCTAGNGFADRTFRHRILKGASVLKEVDRFVRRIGEVGHGTDIAGAVRATYRGHDRVIILSDMQTFGNKWAGNVTDAAPKHVPMYGFNLAGYKHAAIPAGTGTRHELGGMTDQTFRMIPLLEAGRDADWPWK
jgi:hypothetical protein